MDLPYPLLSPASLMRYPLLRRHPHPATVHFPIVFSLSASFFSVLYVLTANRSFDETAFYCLIGAVIFMPLGIVTGFATWWINYMARPMRPATIKKYVSCATAVVVAFLVAWRAYSPGVLDGPSYLSVVYLILVIALSPAVLTVAYYGGTLTFPVEKEGLIRGGEGGGGGARGVVGCVAEVSSGVMASGREGGGEGWLGETILL